MSNAAYSSFLSPKYWPTWLALGVLRLLSMLPLPIIAVLGYGLGLSFYALNFSRRRIAFINIQSCFPELSPPECRRINRRHYAFAGQTVFATAMNWWIPAHRFNKLVTVHGREDYDQALADKKNIILLAPHFLALDVGGYALAQERPMITMYQYSKNQLMDEMLQRGRTRYGGLLVERKSSLRNLIRLIRQGHPFYYLPDQDAGRKGVFVDFFNIPASTIPMLGRFASMAKASVIPCRVEIRPWGKGYDVYLGKALADFPRGDDIADTQTMNHTIEEMIRTCPQQYFWAHKRFKTRPPSDLQQKVNFYK